MLRIYTIVILCLCFAGSPSAPLANPLEEPEPPDVSSILNREKEEQINKIKNNELGEIFILLHDDAMYLDDEVFNKAAYESFKSRKKRTVEFVTNYLKKPRGSQAESLPENRDFHVAKRILRIFPAESSAHLTSIYKRADSTTKGNILSVLGKMYDPTGQAVKDLLMQALEDRTIFEEEDHVELGEPLRICDMAYNQLILRYNIKGVLRTIGNVHTVDVRDYHIQLLKNSFK